MFNIVISSTEHNVLSTEDALSIAIENQLFAFEAKIVRLILVGKTRFYASVDVCANLGVNKIVAIMGYCKTITLAGKRRTRFYGIHEDDALVLQYGNCPVEILNDLDEANTFKASEWRKEMVSIHRRNAIMKSVAAGDVLLFPEGTFSILGGGAQLRVAVCLNKKAFQIMRHNKAPGTIEVALDELPSIEGVVLVKKIDLKPILRGQICPEMIYNSGYFYKVTNGDTLILIGRCATHAEELQHQTLIGSRAKFISKLLDQRLWFM